MSARCFCPCHTHPGTYPPPCGVCGHDTREGRMAGGYRDGWEPHPPVCQDCGTRHEPNDKAACIEGHGDDTIQVTIHGKYGQGPMPVEFRDALVEMVRLVKQGIDDGTLGRPSSPAPTPARGGGEGELPAERRRPTSGEG